MSAKYCTNTQDLASTSSNSKSFKSKRATKSRLQPVASHTKPANQASPQLLAVTIFGDGLVLRADGPGLPSRGTDAHRYSSLGLSSAEDSPLKRTRCRRPRPTFPRPTTPVSIPLCLVCSSTPSFLPLFRLQMRPQDDGWPLISLDDAHSR